MKKLLFQASRIILHIYYLFPIKRNKIFFESYSGKGYLCNPKYISDYINKHYPLQYSLIWGMNDPPKYEDEYFKAVKKNTFRYFFDRLTSKAIITNVADSVYIPKRKGQIIINTWHAGGAYKRVGNSFKGADFSLTEWQSQIICNDTDVYLSSSELFTKYNIIEGYGFRKTIMDIGMPRNDIFFDEDKVKTAKRKVNCKYNTENSFVILYAPTFRNVSHNIHSILPYKKIVSLIEQMYKTDVVIMQRSHHYDKDYLRKDEEALVVDVSNYNDMQELLARADMLITDYSSCMWDYALVGRPCFLYVPDLQTYDIDRGFFTPPELWPGVICHNENELLEQIGNVNFKEALDIANKHLARFKSYEKGIATKKYASI